MQYIARLPIAGGLVTLVDLDDFESLSEHKWRYAKSQTASYVKRTLKRPDGTWSTSYLHREIMSAPKGVFVDHIDGNTLNNSRKNLRLCTRQQNMWNSKIRVDGAVRLKGVSVDRLGFKATIKVDGRHISLGIYQTAEEAHAAYCGAARVAFGEFWRKG